MARSVFTDPIAAIEDADYLAGVKRQSMAVLRDKKGLYRIQVAATTRRRERIVCEISSRNCRGTRSQEGRR